MTSHPRAAFKAVRKAVKRVPYSQDIYRRLKGTEGEGAIRLNDLAGSEDRARDRLLNLLSYTKTSGSAYAAEIYPAGYHEIEINGEVFAGQRRPQARLDQVPLDFTGLSVLDIGCNQGGMLHALGTQTKWKVGVDFNPHMINACNLIAKERGDTAADFYVFDIDKDDHGLIENFLPEPRVDVIFLLAVCMWVTRWKELIDLTATLCTQMVFESNGSDAEQDAQEAHLRLRYGTVTKLADASEDDPAQKRRRLYLCQDPKPKG